VVRAAIQSSCEATGRSSFNTVAAIARDRKRPKSVLYAEDDAALRELTARMLTRAGYTIVAVPDGLAAWNTLNAREFDLLITDNDMPRLTGLELVTKLRLKKMVLPIILASGSADFFRSPEYRWLDFKACLQKPFMIGKLLYAVGAVLNGESVG
jgi:DNA-binding response OmpR family regulator